MSQRGNAQVDDFEVGTIQMGYIYVGNILEASKHLYATLAFHKRYI